MGALSNLDVERPSGEQGQLLGLYVIGVLQTARISRLDMEKKNIREKRIHNMLVRLFTVPNYLYDCQERPPTGHLPFKWFKVVGRNQDGPPQWWVLDPDNPTEK